MPEARALEELFRVEDRYQRSVDLAADYRREDALRGYVVTPLVRTVLRRISVGLGSRALNRAWSITGPYGAGKSACAVFLCRVLGYPLDEKARSLLRTDDAALEEQLYAAVPGLREGGFLMAPIVGSRQPLWRSVVSGLRRALAGLPGESAAVAAWAEELAALERAEEAPLPGDIVRAVERTAEAAQAARPEVLGLIIVYDELGKALEYATLNPESSDVGLLQMLAEAAARSRKQRVALVTVLHQGFENYADRLSPVQRREWAKVQGRFEDIAFLQSSGELLGLVGRAIRRVERDDGLGAMAAEEAWQAESLGMLPGDMAEGPAREALERCAPLHPSVALVLGKLFRSRMAQNERSLFAFLSSGEPQGFQEFLQTERWGANGQRPFYRLDRLYDYVQGALGSGLTLQAQGKRWAEIEEALERLPAGAEALDARLVNKITFFVAPLIIGGQDAPLPTTAAIGELLMQDYILPFEVASILLLLALIGAAMIVRRRSE